MDGDSPFNKVEDVYVSHVEDAVTFWGQSFNRICEISKISDSLATVCPSMIPVFGIPNLDKVYGGMFSADKCWYRCKLQHVVDDEQCAVTYIDYGNSEVLNRSNIVELPENLQMPPVAHKFRLWGLQLHNSSDIEQGLQFLSKLIADKQVSVQQKSVYKDGTIVVQVMLENLDVGEEVIKKGFAERSKLLNSQNGSRETCEVLPNHEKSQFPWPVRVERPPMREPKSSAVYNRCFPQQKVSDQHGNHGRSNFQATRLSPEFNGFKSDQRRLDENNQLKDENRQLRDEMESLMQKLSTVEMNLQKMHLDMKKERELSEETIHELEVSLKSAAGNRLKVLTTKINELRSLRCDNECMSVADDLLEAVKVVSEEQLSAPSTLKSLDDKWKEYHLVQEMIQACVDVVDLDLLIDKRNKIQQTLNSSVDDFIVEVEKLPLDERLTKLKMLMHSLKIVYGTTSVDCEDSDSVFQEFHEWKQARLLTFNTFRNDTNTSLGIICAWFSDVQQLFDLTSASSLCTSDNVEGIDGIIEKVDTDVSKELEVSLKEPNQTEREIIINTSKRVAAQINKEICLIETIKSKFVSSVELRKNIVQWINKNPNVDDLMAVKKTIKGLKGQLRWKLLESSNMEESEEYNETVHSELKLEIVGLRNKIFFEIQREQEEYAKLSDLVQKWFPELPLMYSDAGILNYMNSGGLLSSSMERILFDAEPMKELSSKRPLLCTEVQDKKVLLKGYSVGADTEEQVVVRAAEYHKAWMLRKEESGIMELLYLFFCKFDPMVYLMVPFYAGENLGTVQTVSPLNSYETVKVMSGVVQGMQTLHAANIIIGSLHENNVFAINRERGIIGDFDFTRDAEQRTSATSICFSLWTAPELKEGQPASAATDVYTFGMLLLWLCIGNKDIPFNSNGTPDLQAIDVDARAKGLLSSLLCRGDRMETKQIKDHEYFQIAEITPLPDLDEEFDETVLDDSA